MSATDPDLRGTWRNHLGATLEVIKPVEAVLFFKSLGRIWEAYSVYENVTYMPTTFDLVTAESLADAGYRRVEVEATT